jgi:aspartate/methionine/tyrosine aminotransferase
MFMTSMPDFELERYLVQYEFNTPHLLCCSDCQTLTVSDLLAMDGGTERFLMDLPLGYTEASGAEWLRREIAGMYRDLSPDNILVFSGAGEGIFTFMNAALDSGDHVVVQYPGYQSLFQVAKSLGADVTLWEMDPEAGWQTDISDLAGLIRPNTRAVVINSPHNPIGRVLGEGFYQDLARMADENGFMIFSDEVFRFLEYNMDRFPSMTDFSDTAVSLGDMSKSFGLAGLRIGWAVSRNKDVMDRMAAFKDYTTICCSGPSEVLALAALRRRDHILETNRRIIADNLSLFERFMTKWEDRFDWTPPQGGTMCFPRLRNGSPSDDFCREVREGAGVLLLPGRVYGAAFAAHFRVGLGWRNFTQGLNSLDNWLAERNG